MENDHAITSGDKKQDVIFYKKYYVKYVHVKRIP